MSVTVCACPRARVRLFVHACACIHERVSKYAAMKYSALRKVCVAHRRISSQTRLLIRRKKNETRRLVRLETSRRMLSSLTLIRVRVSKALASVSLSEYRCACTLPLRPPSSLWRPAEAEGRRSGQTSPSLLPPLPSIPLEHPREGAPQRFSPDKARRRETVTASGNNSITTLHADCLSLRTIV